MAHIFFNFLAPVFFGMAAHVGSAVAAGYAIGVLGAADPVDPPALAAGMVAGITASIFGGYVCARFAQGRLWTHMHILALLATGTAYAAALVEYHVVTPEQYVDTISAALVPFVYPLTLLGGWMAQRAHHET
jgi:hypothetical protein